MSKNKTPKRRYNSSRIAKSPLLKKTIAILLAEHMPRSPETSLTAILAYGHRGYISYSEDDLCKMFDKLYSSVLEDLNGKIKKLNDQDKKYSWQDENIRREIAGYQQILKQFENVADEIFEKKVLL